MRSRALTLAEVLITVAIILLILLLLLPVLNLARKNAQKTQCMNNLHQIGTAVLMYRADYKESFPYQLALTLPYSKSDAIYVCPTEGPATGLSLIEGVSTNYVSILRPLSNASTNTEPSDSDTQAAKILMELDPNHGVLVCLLHGERRVHDEPALGSHEGLHLRLQVDSSVKPVHVYYAWVRGTGYIPGWFVFTDVRPCPPEIVRLAPVILDCPPE